MSLILGLRPKGVDILPFDLIYRNSINTRQRRVSNIISCRPSGLSRESFSSESGGRSRRRPPRGPVYDPTVGVQWAECDEYLQWTCWGIEVILYSRNPLTGHSRCQHLSQVHSLVHVSSLPPTPPEGVGFGC